MLNSELTDINVLKKCFARVWTEKVTFQTTSMASWSTNMIE